jgi:hypothetical protein
MIYRGPGFLAVVEFGYSHTPSSLSRQYSSTDDTQEELADGREEEGPWEEPNQTTARKPGPL